jgi:hypothetical protein
MFQLNGQPLALDTPFTHNEIQYPANWLRLASLEEKHALGITEVDDPVHYDDRFYWGVGNPKDLDQCKDVLTAQIKQCAFGTLSVTDYKFTRMAETGEAVDQDTLDYRAAVRQACADNLALIASATTVDELAAVQFTWPTEGE